MRPSTIVKNNISLTIPMSKHNASKILFVLVSLTLLTGSAVAQSGMDNPFDIPLNTIATGFVDFADSISGPELMIGTLGGALAFTAGLAIILLFIYIAIEIGLKQANLYDKVAGSSGYGNDGSNRRIAALSFLVLVLMFGSGALVPLVAFMIQYTVITVVLGFIAAGAMIWIAGAGGVMGGFSGALGTAHNARGAGKEMLKDGKKRLAKSKKDLSEAKSLEDDIEKKEKTLKNLESEVQALLNEGDLDDATQDIEVVIQKLKNLEDEFSRAEQDIEDAVLQVEKAEKDEVQTESEIEQELEDAVKQAKKVRSDFDHVAKDQGMNNFNDLEAIMTALAEVDDAVRKQANVHSLINEEEGILKRLRKLEDKLENELSFLNREITNEAQMGAKAKSMAEKLKDREDYERVQNELQQTEQLEKRFEQLMKSFQKIKSDTQEAVQQAEALESKEGEYRKLFRSLAKQFEDIKQHMRDAGVANNLKNQYGARSVQKVTEKVNQMEQEVKKLDRELSR